MKSKQKALNARKVVELRLYVAGQTPKSLAAIANLEKICADGFDGDYHVESMAFHAINRVGHPFCLIHSGAGNSSII